MLLRQRYVWLVITVLGSFRDLVRNDGVVGALPDSLVTYLSASLPDGLKYKLSDDGSCLVAVSDDERLDPVVFRLQAPEFELSSGGERAFKGIEKNEENVARYLRNSQETAYLKPDTKVVTAGGATMLLKDVILPADALGKSELVKINVEPLAPLQVPMSVVSEDGRWNIVLKQRPNKSVFEERYDGEYKAVSFALHLNIRSETQFQLSITVKPNQAKNASEYYDCLALYNALMEGEILFGDALVQLAAKRTDGRPRKQAQEFWKKAAWLEEKLGQAFIVTTSLDVETVRNVETLYTCWKEGRAVKRPHSIDSISGYGVIEEDKIKQGQRSSMITPYRSQLMVFGVTVDASGYIGVFDFNVLGVSASKDQANDEGLYPFALDVSCSEKTLVSVLYLDEGFGEGIVSFDDLAAKLSNPIELTPSNESLY